MNGDVGKSLSMASKEARWAADSHMVLVRRERQRITCQLESPKQEFEMKNWFRKSRRTSEHQGKRQTGRYELLRLFLH